MLLAACGKRAEPIALGATPSDASPSLTGRNPLDAGPAFALPPHADTCASDAECGVTSLDLEGPLTCCLRCCSMHGGRKDWTDAVEATCKAAHVPCAPVACACPSPPFKPKCASGRCTLVY